MIGEYKAMNILITLPKHLIDKIISGEKKYEMRRCQPKYMRVGEDGFFVVEKGTDKIRCWCRVDRVIKGFASDYSAAYFAPYLCVPQAYIRRYAKDKMVYLWKIGKVKTFTDLKRDPMLIKRNPMQFVYWVLSYGESF